MKILNKKDFKDIKKTKLENAANRAGLEFNVLDKIIKTPVKYPKATARMVFFPISSKKADDLINNNRLKPVSILGGKSILGITIFDYIESDVGPYREIALSIPVMKDTKFNIPFLPLIFDDLFKNFGFYTILLAMNNDMGREHSEKVFGYPTYKKNINIEIDENDTEALIKAEEDEKKIFDLKIHSPNNFKLLDKRYNTYIKGEKNSLSCVKMNTASIEAQSMSNSGVSLDLGDHEISKTIKNLLIEKKVLKNMYCKKLVEILSEPKDV